MSGIESNPGPCTQDVRPNNKSSPRTLVFGSLNVRSAVKKGALIRDLIESHNIDILAACETWFNPDDPNAIKLDMAPPGYITKNLNIAIPGRAGRCGGLALIYRDTLTIRAHPIMDSIQTTSFHYQASRLTIENKTFCIINIYRWPDSNVNVFYDELSSLLADVTVAVDSDRLVVCGDLNCPGSTESTVADQLTEVLNTFGLTQLVTKPTRFGSTSKNLLDVMITGHGSPFLSNIEVCSTHELSDHCLVRCELNQTLNRRLLVTFQYRKLKQLDIGLFRAELAKSELFTAPEQTVDAFAQQINSIVNSILDKLAPIRSFKKCVGKRMNRWLSHDAVEAKRVRRRLERKWKATGDENVRKVYRQSCRDANKKINDSRVKHYAEIIGHTTDGTRQRWTAVKDILHSTEPAEALSSAECSRRCRLFSDFFVDKINKIKSLISSSVAPLQDSMQYDDLHDVSLSTLKPVTSGEVFSVLRSHPMKSSPQDSFPPSLLKSCPDLFAQILAKLANLSFSTGTFPSGYKTAAVTPLLKKSGLDPDDPANFRPISNLNTISKILERLFLSRLLPHVLSSPGYNKFQSAYRRHHSTETALTKILDDVYNDIGNHRQTVLVGLDLSAAFDTINQSTLIHRLDRSFGIRGSVLEWVKSYLTDRSQYVCVGRAHSPAVQCKHGVPQGSVLGPILFTLYVSPIAKIIASFGITHHQYADDTQLYISLQKNNFDKQTQLLTQCSDALQAWFQCNGLALNPTKSEVIALGTPAGISGLKDHTHVNIAGANITVSKTLKSLGVTLDNKLSFAPHIGNICKGCYFHIRALRHIKSSLPPGLLKTVACSIVCARLDYCNSLLYGVSKQNIRKLQVVQNSLARLVSGTRKFDHITPVLSDLHWLPVSQRITFKIATLTFKILSSQQPSYLASIIHKYQPTRSLRSSAMNKLAVPSSSAKSSVTACRAFSVAAPTVWNGLPVALTDPNISYDIFRQRLKTHLFKTAFE